MRKQRFVVGISMAFAGLWIGPYLLSITETTFWPAFPISATSFITFIAGFAMAVHNFE